MALSNIPVLDLNKVQTFPDFDAVMNLVTTEEAGARVWLPDKVFATAEALASSLPVDQLVQACLQGVTAASADNPPALCSVVIAANSAGGSEAMVLLRTQRALLQATIEYLWRSSDNGGLREAGGFAILPTALPRHRSICNPLCPSPQASTPFETSAKAAQSARLEEGDSSLETSSVDAKADSAQSSLATPASDLLTIVTVSNQEEYIATGGIEPTSTSPAQVALYRWKKKVVRLVCFGYSILMTVLSVNNAITTGSFSATMTTGIFSANTSVRSLNQNAAFSMSALMEASGLAIGACMSIAAYFKANERSLWSDLLSEPYMILFKGIGQEGQGGRALMSAGIFGTFCQAVSIFAFDFYIYIASTEETEETEERQPDCARVSYHLILIAGTGCYFYVLVSLRGRTDCSSLFSCLGSSCLASIPLLVEASEVFYLTRPSVSGEDYALIVTDVLAIVTLSVITLASVPAVSFVLIGQVVYGLTRLCCPLSCRESVEFLHPKRSVQFLVKQFARINLVTPEGNEPRPASSDANASPIPV